MIIKPIPSRARDLVKFSESCVLQAYLDDVGVPTIGWGYTNGVKLGTSITQQKADELLERELIIAAAAATRLTSVPLNTNQYAALIDFIYNLGAGAYQRSTIRLKLNRSEYHEGSKVLLKYVYAKGVILRGLVTRRKQEYYLFNS